MKFSVALPTAYEGLGYPLGMLRRPSDLVRLARTAEHLGYDAVVYLEDAAESERAMARSSAPSR